MCSVDKVSGVAGLFGGGLPGLDFGNVPCGTVAGGGGVPPDVGGLTLTAFSSAKSLKYLATEVPSRLEISRLISSNLVMPDYFSGIFSHSLNSGSTFTSRHPSTLVSRY